LLTELSNRIIKMRTTTKTKVLCAGLLLTSAVAGFAKGLAPLTAVEVARRSLDSGVQPAADELEQTLKAMPSPGK